MMEGETVVVGKYFVDFAKKLEKEQVELCRLFDGQLQIKYSESESELQVFPSENYPIFDRDDNGNYFEISYNDFKEVVEKTVFSCSTDDSRPILKGCLFEIKGSELTSVALDGFRMSVVKKKVNASCDMKAVIPSRTLAEITRLLDKEEDTLKIFLLPHALFVQVENTCLCSRLIEGEFVRYNHILPTAFSNKVTVNRLSLLSSIERASIVARNDRYNVIKFDIKENVMSVSAKSEVGTVNENVTVMLDGKDMAIAFNGKYISEYLKIVSDEFISLNLNTAIDPCVITPVGKEENLYLVLPVRINA
jgi:DNA polymerase-3 subunit beta